MIFGTGLAQWEFEFPFPGSLTSAFPGEHGAGAGGGLGHGACEHRLQVLTLFRQFSPSSSID